MAFDYGVQKLNIRNPFRFEGVVRGLRGLIVTVLGVYLLLKVPALVQTDRPQAWIDVAIGTLFVATGLRALGGGLFQMLRFFVGRSAPASLAKNVGREAVAEKEPAIYSGESLQRMLMSRINPTLTEPEGWFSRSVHTLFPHLICAPYPVRYLGQALVFNITKTLIALVAFGVAAFLVSTGLAGTGNAPMLLLLLEIFVALYLIKIWFSLGNPLASRHQRNAQNISSASLTVTIVVSIVGPVLLSLLWSAIWHQLQPLAQQQLIEVQQFLIADLHPWTWLLAILAGAAVSAVVVGWLVFQRAGMLEINTRTSERTDTFQQDIHPNQIFITMRDRVLMDRRNKELPNRSYLESNNTHASEQMNQQFQGEMLQEVQPDAVELPEPATYRLMRMLGTVVGQLLLLGAALMLMYGADTLLAQYHTIHGLVPLSPHASHAAWMNLFKTLMHALAQSSVLIWVFLLWGFGRSLSRAVHLFWAEIHFQSVLVYFTCEGTSSLAQKTRGDGMMESRGSNQTYFTDMTFRVLVSRILSSTFAVSGTQNLEQPRLVLSMEPADDWANGVVQDFRDRLRHRQTISGDTEMDQAVLDDIQSRQLKRQEAEAQIRNQAELERLQAAKMMDAGTLRAPESPHELEDQRRRQAGINLEAGRESSE